MKHVTFLRTVFAIALCGLSADAFAQDRPDYQNVNNNARSARVAARAPGRLVSAGLNRSREFMNNAFDGTNIDQEASAVPLSPWAQARIEALQIVFTNLNIMINAFHNTIRAQAGLDPVPPRIPDFPDVSGGDTGGTDGGTDDGSGDGIDIPDGIGDDLGDILDDFGITKSKESARTKARGRRGS